MSGRLDGRLIALGVTGSIAAYKTPELVRALQAEGADVVALLTPAAGRFVAPLALEALTRHPVEHDVMALLPDERIGHIVIAETADVVVVAPATAHWLGAMAGGLAGDVVTATCLATEARVVVAPAMDGAMWQHPATQANAARLREKFGYRIVGPDTGPLASGASGVGRLTSIGAIVDAVVEAAAGRPIREPDGGRRPPRQAGQPREADLEGRHVVVTAGGTIEPIDPVRFIGNRSTGRMGVALAEAALDRGAAVTLVVGQVSVPPPPRATIVRVETAADMERALDGIVAQGFDALVMAAAVADFRPSGTVDRKIERSDGLTLRLEPTPDLVAGVVAAVSDQVPRPVIVGFAAETGSLDRAGDKLRRKGVDLLVANDVSEPGSGFGSDTNRVTILSADGSSEPQPLLPKREVAERILDRVAGLLLAGR
jgi:phosphopantothenoylcysteine decarboxylase/phosphopantothenate--cysteine ligase